MDCGPLWACEVSGSASHAPFQSTLNGIDRTGVSSSSGFTLSRFFGVSPESSYVLAELLGCDVGCVPFFYAVFSVVYLYFVVVDFEYF